MAIANAIEFVDGAHDVTIHQIPLSEVQQLNYSQLIFDVTTSGVISFAIGGPITAAASTCISLSLFFSERHLQQYATSKTQKNVVSVIIFTGKMMALSCCSGANSCIKETAKKVTLAYTCAKLSNLCASYLSSFFTFNDNESDQYLAPLAFSSGISLLATKTYA
ncbi:MAG: hypothetical protein ACPGUD_14195 [Parashewanella sp.]